MTKKILAVAMVIALCACMGVSAATETPVYTDVDWKFEQGGTNWTIKGVVGTNAIYDTTPANVKEGTTSLKLVNDGSDTAVTNVRAYALITEGAQIVGQKLIVSGYLKIANLAADASVKVSINNGSVADARIWRSVEFNATDVGDGWKFFSFAPLWKSEFGANNFLLIKLSGVGTVYLDDFAAYNTTNLAVNGDFDALSDTDACFDWRSIATNRGAWGVEINSSTDVKFSGQAALKLARMDNGYNTQLYQISDAYNKLLPGQNYKVSFMYKLADDATEGTPGVYLYNTADKTVQEEIPGIVQTATINGWEKYEGCFRLPTDWADGALGFGISGKTLPLGSSCYYDDLSVEIDTTEYMTLTNAAGEAVTQVTAGDTLTATYHAISDKTAAEGGVARSFFAAVYSTIGTVKTLETISTMDTTTVNLVDNADAFGSAAANIIKSITVPSDTTKTYTVKVFCWDGPSSMTPHLEMLSVSQ